MTTLDRQTIGNRIKHERQELKMTQKELASKLSMNKSTIQRYESGKIETIKQPVIEKIAQILNINVDYLNLKTNTKYPSFDKNLKQCLKELIDNMHTTYEFYRNRMNMIKNITIPSINKESQYSNTMFDMLIEIQLFIGTLEDIYNATPATKEDTDNNKITKEQIQNGINNNLIKFVTDPNMESGTVCSIGNYWFYFGGYTAETENPEEYLKNVPLKDIIDEIYSTLESFRTDETYADEYAYYADILK